MDFFKKMAKRIEGGADRAERLIYNTEKGTMEAVLPNGRGFVGQMLGFDRNRAVVATDGLNGAVIARLVKVPESPNKR